MNGIEVTRQIRSLGDDTPIIILTAYDWSDIEVEARAAGVTAFCSKPMFMSDIRETLMAAIGQKQAEAEDLSLIHIWMVETVNYVKVQCSTYTHYNEASESKSLLRAKMCIRDRP